MIPLPDMSVTLKMEDGFIVAAFYYEPVGWKNKLKFIFGKVEIPKVAFSVNGTKVNSDYMLFYKRYGLKKSLSIHSGLISVPTGIHKVDLLGEDVKLDGFSRALRVDEI